MEVFGLSTMVFLSYVAIGIGKEAFYMDLSKPNSKKYDECNYSISPNKTEKAVMALCQAEVHFALLTANVFTAKSRNKFTLPESTTFKTNPKILRVVSNLEKNYKKIQKKYLAEEDVKRAAGCIFYCTHVKLNQVDWDGVPTLEGMISFHIKKDLSPGQAQAMNKALQYCYNASNYKRLVISSSDNKVDEMCDFTYETIRCSLEEMLSYCSSSSRSNAPRRK